MNKLIIASVIILLIIIIIYCTRDPTIDGFWSGDIDFCNESGISSMLIYFDKSSITGTRNCYMYIGPDVAMQQFTIHHGLFTTTAEYDDDDEIWPDKLLLIRRNDTLYIWDTSKQILYAKLHARADLNHATLDD